MGARLLVLGWHNVEATPCFAAPPGRGTTGLHHQLSALSRLANVVPLAAALADLDAGRPLPPRAVALTFDDGYADVLSLAAPMLERLGLPATFFLVPGLLGREVAAWWEVLAAAFSAASADRLDEPDTSWTLTTPADRHRAFAALAERLKRVDAKARDAAVEDLVARLEPRGRGYREDLFLDWDGARELVRRGHAIGSHTTAHVILSQESAAAQLSDIVGARRRLQDELGVGAEILAYPNGRAQDFDAASIDAAAAAGHSHSLTTIEGRQSAGGPPHEIRRCVAYPERGYSELVVSMRHAFPRRKRS